MPFPMRLNVDGSTWGPYEKYLQRHSEALLHDAAFRAHHPGMARSYRVALVSQLAHLDPDLESLTSTNADLAEGERARTVDVILRGGRMPAIEIHDGGFPPMAPSPLPNLLARARLQGHRDAGATHAFVQFAASGPSLREILSKPPWAWSSAPPPAVQRRREPNARRVPRWIR